MSFESRMIRTNAGLAVTATAALVLILVWERHGLSTGELEARRGQLVTHFVRDRVSELTIEREGGNVVLFRERENDDDDELGEWKLREPIETTTDTDAVDSLLSSVEWATARRTLAGISAADVERFGLDEPRVRLRFRIGDPAHGGAEEHVLALGGDDPQGAGVYAQLDDATDAYVVGRDLYEALDHDADHFRAREVFLDFGTMQASVLEVGRAENAWRVEKHDARYDVVSPFDGWASDRAVRDLLSKLADIKAERFVEEHPDDVSRYGLDSPSLTLHIERTVGDGDETRRATLRVGTACADHEGELYARADEGPVVCVPASELEPFDRTAADLRELRLVTREDEDVDGLEVEGRRAHLSLRRGDDGFTLESGGETNDIDEDALADFMADLRSIRAVAFLPADGASLRSLGLATPSRTITIHTNDEDDEVVHIGASDSEGVYARRGEEPAVLRLAPDAEELLDVTPLRFRSRGLVDATIEAATELRVRRGTVEEVVVRDGDGFRVTAPIEAAAENADVREALRSLTSLEAVRFVAETATPAQGLAHPRFVARVSIEASGEGDAATPASEHTLHIGADTDDGAFATLDADPAVFVVTRAVVDSLTTPLLSRGLLATDLSDLLGDHGRGRSEPRRAPPRRRLVLARRRSRARHGGCARRRRRREHDARDRRRRLRRRPRQRRARGPPRPHHDLADRPGVRAPRLHDPRGSRDDRCVGSGPHERAPVGSRRDVPRPERRARAAPRPRPLSDGPPAATPR